jgi:hypothetical protein
MIRRPDSISNKSSGEKFYHISFYCVHSLIGVSDTALIAPAGKPDVSSRCMYICIYIFVMVKTSFSQEQQYPCLPWISARERKSNTDRKVEHFAFMQVPLRRHSQNFQRKKSKNEITNQEPSHSSFPSCVCNPAHALSLRGVVEMGLDILQARPVRHVPVHYSLFHPRCDPIPGDPGIDKGVVG